MCNGTNEGIVQDRVEADAFAQARRRIKGGLEQEENCTRNKTTPN